MNSYDYWWDPVSFSDHEVFTSLPLHTQCKAQIHIYRRVCLFPQGQARACDSVTTELITVSWQQWLIWRWTFIFFQKQSDVLWDCWEKQLPCWSWTDTGIKSEEAKSSWKTEKDRATLEKTRGDSPGCCWNSTISLEQKERAICSSSTPPLECASQWPSILKGRSAGLICSQEMHSRYQGLCKNWFHCLCHFKDIPDMHTHTQTGTWIMQEHDSLFLQGLRCPGPSRSSRTWTHLVFCCTG